MAEVPVTRLERTMRRALLRARSRPLDPDFRIFGRLGLPGDGLVLDIGANHGFAIDAIRLALPAAPIVAFEPNPSAAEYLAWAFGPSVAVHCCALGSVPGIEALYVPRYRRRILDGLASLDRDAAENWLHGRTLGRGDVAIATVEVPVRTLDEFGLAPALIKIDVQGRETAVVEGGLQTIGRHRPVLFIEAPDQELAALLAELRYERFGLRAGELDKSGVETKNVLFVPKGLFA
jgi:FkbM family methyltransferase